MMQNRFAVMWDKNGLEAVASIQEFEKRKMWAMLEGRAPDDIQPPNIMHWRLRAQMNSQRHVEIYIIDADPDITEQDLREAFEADPQGMVDTIRRIGHEFYSDRDTRERVIF